MDNFFHRLGIFIKNKHKVLCLLGLALLVPAIIGAMMLKMETGYKTFVNADSKVYKDYERFTHSFSDQVLIVLVTADNLNQLVQQDNMAAMQAVENDTNGKAGVVSSVGPAFFIKQEVARNGGSSELPTDPQTILGIITDPQSGAIKDNFRQVFPDNSHAFIAITIDASLSQNKQSDVVEDIKQTVSGAGFGENVNIKVSGLPAAWVEIRNLMSDSMKNMLILSVVLMLIILAFIFSVRGFFAWRWLPLGVVFLGIIYALGVMGVLSVPITIVTMSSFPVLIGLGVDYAIQFHNRYDEEIKTGKSAKDAIITSVNHIGSTIGMAIVVACVGFVALFFSPCPMIRDFGLTLIIGVVCCYILSMFFLLSVLFWHGKRSKGLTEKAEPVNTCDGKKYHIIDRALCRLAPVVIRNPAVIIIIALLLTGAGLFVDHSIKTQSDELKFLSQDVPAIKNINTLKSLGTGIVSTNLFVEAEDITDPAVLSWVLQIEQRVNEEQSDIVANTSSIADIVKQSNDGVIPQDSQKVREIIDKLSPAIKSNLVTDDFTGANIILSHREVSNEIAKVLSNSLKEYISEHPDNVNVTITGTSQINIKLQTALTSGREKMTMMGIVFVFAALILLWRLRILRALLATIPMLLIIGWSSGVMYLLGLKFNPLSATLGALIIGIGVEFTILLMRRYYEERDKGNNPEEAMTTAIARIGRAIIASGFTVIGGFGSLLIATDFPIIRDFGIVTLIDVFLALVTTLVVLPPMIVLIDRWLERRQMKKLKVGENKLKSS